MQSEFEKWWSSERDHCYAEDKDCALSVWNAAGAALLAHEKAEMRDGAGESIQAERVKSRLLGIEDAISAFSDESLLAENKILIEAIDEEMVSCHLGVFNSGDDPRRAINLLMSWAQGLGEYEALRPIDEEDKSAWLKTPMLSSTALTHRSERDANAILANRRFRLTQPPSAPVEGAKENMQDRCRCGHTLSYHTGTAPRGCNSTPCICCGCLEFISQQAPHAESQDTVPRAVAMELLRALESQMKYLQCDEQSDEYPSDGCTCTGCAVVRQVNAAIARAKEIL